MSTRERRWAWQGGRSIEVAVWSVVCLGVWILTLSSVTIAEVCVAIPAALLCGLLAAAGRRLTGGRWRPRTHWVSWLVTLPVSVVAETVGVWRAAAVSVVHSGRGGSERIVALPAEESEDVAQTRRALATLAMSASPGSYVLDFDPERRELVIHTFADGAPSWAQVDPSR